MYVQPRICSAERDKQTSLGLLDTNGSPKLAKMTRPSYSQQKLREYAKLRTLLGNLKKRKKNISIWTLLGYWKTVEHEKNGYTNCNCNFSYSHQRIGTGIGGHGKERTKRDYPNFSTINIEQNTEMSPEIWGELLSIKLQWNTIS